MFTSLLECLLLFVSQSQMFNNYSALFYTAFIEGEVYECTDSCMTEVTKGVMVLAEGF